MWLNATVIMLSEINALDFDFLKILEIYIIISQSVCVCPNTPNSLISQQILELSICMDSLGLGGSRKKY